MSRYGNGAWFISTTVNLTRRSDNGRINSSPVSRSPAIVRWSEGCPSQSLRIPVEDADGDVVKCRYAKYSESYFHNDSFPHGSFDEVISHFFVNRPFYRYGGHIELIRFKEYYRMPRGHEHISFVFSSAFRDIFP